MINTTPLSEVVLLHFKLINKHYEIVKSMPLGFAMKPTDFSMAATSLWVCLSLLSQAATVDNTMNCEHP